MVPADVVRTILTGLYREGMDGTYVDDSTVWLYVNGKKFVISIDEVDSV